MYTNDNDNKTKSDSNNHIMQLKIDIYCEWDEEPKVWIKANAF